MDNKTANETSAAAPSATRTEAKPERRRRSEIPSETVRYFVPKAGSAAAKPELGEEMATEADALVHSFQKGQVFYTLVAWKAVADKSGHAPTIVKEVLPQTRS